MLSDFFKAQKPCWFNRWSIIRLDLRAGWDHPTTASDLSPATSRICLPLRMLLRLYP